jgi:peptide/nickel transport system substrate-binding protein
MENRFGFKDLITVFLFVTLIIVVWLGMVEVDRQGKSLQSIQRQGDQQTTQLAAIRRALDDIAANGIAAAPPVATTTGPAATSTTGPATTAPVLVRRPDSFGNLKEAEKQPDFARGDWLVDNLETKVKKITPQASADLYAEIIQAKVVESLVYRDPDTLEWVPQLARNWQISDDGLTFTFQLRKDVTFSDGEPFTSDDVLYSYQIVMNPKIDAARQRAYYDKVKSVEKHGDYEVVFTMTEPYFQSMDVCGGISVLPRHFYEKFSEDEINSNPGLLMGTGPYRMRDPAGWRPGEKIELLRNDSYWGVPPTFNRIIYLEVEEEAAQETMFGNGEYDIFATQPEQYKRMLADPKTTAHANHFEYSTPLSGYSYIAWNEKRNGKPTVFADPRVRKAMTLLTDRDRINKEIYLGYATTISGPFPAGSPQADTSILPYPFDPDGAKKLLQEAGFRDDGSGVIKGPDGQPLRVRLTYPSKSATYEREVLFLKDSYAKAGITLEPDPEDWPVVQTDLDNRDFDAITLGWGGSIESDLYQEFDSSQIQDKGDNFMSYDNPKFDAVVREARRTIDDKKRMDLWHQAHRILHEDQPYTFLMSRMSLRFIDKRIENIKKSTMGLNDVNIWTMPLPWYVPKAMQKYSN